MPIVNQRPGPFPRLGRIGAGYVGSKEKGGKVVTFPQKSETFVFSGDAKERLEEVARVFGGSVEASPSTDDEGEFRLITKVTEIECSLPTDDERSWDCWMEKWGRGGLIRRCDGVKCLFAVMGNGEIQRDIDCICNALDLGDDRCDPVSRLNIVIPALGAVKGLGVWQVQSRGWGTCHALTSTIDLLRNVGQVARTPLLLKLETRDVRGRDEQGKAVTRTVPILTLTSKLSFADAMRAAQAAPSLPAPASDREQPPLGAATTPAQLGAAREGADAPVPETPPPPQNVGQLEVRLRGNLRILGYKGKTPEVADAIRSLFKHVVGKEKREEFTYDDFKVLIHVTDMMIAGHGLEDAVRQAKATDAA